jgi:HD-GYP domain-containing protein (c-di-GMP phosphodiesterase class II)
MSGHLPARTFSPTQTVRERCRELHLPTWRSDSGGAIVEEPTEAGLAGLWLRAAAIQSLIVSASTLWATSSEPQVFEAAHGCWLIPLVEERRRGARRSGLTIAMALGPAVLKSPLFKSVCRSAGLDEQATRAMFRTIATHDQGFAQQAALMLRWMAQDVASMGEYQDAVRGFTSELSQSYETIDLLYALGRSMLDLEHPEKFVNLACERLHETMPFAWMAARFCKDERIAGALASRLVVRGHAPASSEQLAAALDRLARQAPADMRSFLTSEGEALGNESEARLLVQPIARDSDLAGVMVCGDKRGDDAQVSSYDIQLLEAAAAFTGAFLENARLYREQLALFMGSLKALTAAIDAKDRYTCGHSERVALLASQLARASGYPPGVAERVHICGLVHDVGKIGVPESVLCKPGRLSEEEYALVKLHPEIGHRIIRGIPMLEDILGGVMHHHERWDGGGYPHGLSGEEIPEFARLIGLADTFDAMSSTRSYRGAVSRHKVLEEIARNAGTQFDPRLTEVFLKLDLGAYDRMVARHAREHEGGGEILQAA